MIPDPLHPALVHFPIVLALAAPLAALVLAWAIRAGRLARSAWLGVVALQVVLAASAWLAVETGESEEDRVERVVAEDAIEGHEEAAERFLLLAGLTIPLAAAGLLAGPVGGAARGLTVAAGLAGVLAVANVGHSGGELVYVHGAAQAYTPSATSALLPAALEGDHDEDDEDDD